MLDRADLIFRYDGSLEGLLCCVFESYRSRRLPLDIWESEEPRLSLVPELFIPSHREEAARVWRKLRQLSPEAASWTEMAFLSDEEDKARAIHAFLCLVFRQGRAATRLLGDPAVARAFQLQRQVQGEAHHFMEFLRFQDCGGVLAAQIEPRAFVLPLIASHFAGRFPGESFLIHDKVHGAALLHQGGRMEIRPVEELDLAPPIPGEARYQALWRRYYDAIAIQERLNPRCRRTHCPQRFWNHMLELNRRTPEALGIEVSVPEFSAPVPSLRQPPDQHIPSAQAGANSHGQGIPPSSLPHPPHPQRSEKSARSQE